MTHMTLKYNIIQMGQYWCLNDQLDLSYQQPIHLILATKFLENKKIEKHVGNYFPLSILKILCIFGRT